MRSQNDQLCQEATEQEVLRTENRSLSAEVENLRDHYSEQNEIHSNLEVEKLQKEHESLQTQVVEEQR